MQTNILPIQVTGATPANAPQRQNSGGDSDQFGATLQRQIEQRQPQHAAQPAPQPAKAQQPQDNTAQPDQTQSQAPAQDDARPADASKAQAADDASGAQDKDENKDTTDAKAQPATDMLALIAGFSQLRQATSATAARPGAPAAAAGVGAGKGQAALQAALKGLGKDDAGAAQADTKAQAGEALAAAAHQGAAEGIDLRAAQAIAGFKAHGAAGDAAASLPNFAARLDAAKLAPTSAPLAAPQQLQAAALQAAVPAAAAAANSIGARVGTADWEHQMGQKIVWMAAGGEQSASLTLNPPDLGPLQVVLSVTGDQASVAFSASQQEVRHALESSLPRLREMMSESGIALGNATVSAGMPDQRQAQGDNTGSGGRGASGMADSVAGVDSAPATAVRTTLLGDGMVDTFV
jgi:flagellar hook-length control protein FliK